jgi:hypothetical protein
MITLAVTCGYATFYEMQNGTPAVQRDIYRTAGFAFLLGLLGVNVFAVMVSRYPWTKHHIGFLTAHVGILAVLTGSLVSLYRGLDSNLALYEGEGSDRVRLLDKALHVSFPGQPGQGTFPVSFEKHPPRPGNEKRFAVSGSDVILVAEAYEPHVAVTDSFEPAETGSPALHFVLQAPMATQDGWLVPDDPQRGHADFGMVSFGFHASRGEEEARKILEQAEGANHVSFALVPGGKLLFAVTGTSGPTKTGEVKVGQPVPTGWAGLGLTVDRFLERAAVRRLIAPEAPPAKEEQRNPAVRVHLESPSARSEAEWLLWGETQRVRLGNRTAIIGYRSPEVGLPFRVTLLKFNDEKYPGSNMPLTYESRVRIDDPETGSFETLISMNHPLHHRGYIFFQSSFVEGTPMASIFSVARAPGLPLVYLGTALIGIGIAWMFYVKPYLAKRQAARALEAYRAREGRDEAKSADPVSARA